MISAQGLKPPSTSLRRLQTYAVAWFNSAAKLKTRVDSLSGENPTWNDKVLFRVFDEFISGDNSGVSVEIFGVGYLEDFLIGTVRFLLSMCINKMDPIRSSGGGTPAFTAVQIRRPSGRFQGVLSIAAAVYDSSECGVLDKVSAVSFRELMEKKETESRRRLSRSGSKQSSGGESCDFSDSSDSTASTALKDCNWVREMAGKEKGNQSNSGGLLLRFGDSKED